jgi:hypothetical protein
MIGASAVNRDELPFAGTYLACLQKEIVRFSMHRSDSTSRYEMTPARIIINATIYGVLAWVALYLLQSLFLIVEPILNEKLIENFGHPVIWYSLHESWYGQVLEMFHPLVILSAVAYSAVRDFLDLRSSHEERRGTRIQHHGCLEHTHIGDLGGCNTGSITIVILRKSHPSKSKRIRNHICGCCCARNS